MDLIDQIYTKFPYYGSRRMSEELKRQGEAVGRKRARSLMRVMGIEPIYQRPRTSIPNPDHHVYPYLLKGIAAGYANHIWGVDITYIRMRKEWLYLVAILDWYSRYVLSWELSDNLAVEFCLAALNSALQISLPKIHNSDQGSQFTSEDYLALLLAYPQISISMDGRGRCMDNIFTERFWRTLKYEEVYLKDYTSPREARQSIGEYIRLYNQDRIHSSLDYLTPAEVYFGKRTLNIK